MLRTLQKAVRPAGQKSLAEAFSRLGWTGFWMQIAIGSIPLALYLYGAFFSGSRGAGTRGGLAIVEYATVISLLILIFTTCWFIRYVRLGAQIADPTRRPQSLAVQRTAWIGIAASTLGITLSMLITLMEVAQLLIYFLRAPQAGVPVVQTTAGPASWISAADVVNLMILSVTMLVEVLVLALSVWLLFRSMVTSLEYPATEGRHGEPAVEPTST